MEIKKIDDKNIWENFLAVCQEKTFLQSWNWGEFNQMMGNKIWRLGVYDEEKLVSVALVVKIQAKRGTFLFVPHAPSVLATKDDPTIKQELFSILLEKLKKIAREERASFIRIAPIWQRNEENINVFRVLKFRDASIHIHPELTWELDLTPSEEELLMNMRKTTRYLIRQAKKIKELEIFQSQEVKDIEIFNKLYQEVVSRHHFVPFPMKYLKNEFLAFLPDNQILMFFGKYKGEIISSAIIIFWSNIAFYHHGATSLKYPKIPVSYLLQWEAIREAKKRNCQKFNFWGIAPENKKNHPWRGLTLFKIGFGGYKKEYLKTQDFPLSKKYWLTYFFEKLRKIKRGL